MFLSQGKPAELRNDVLVIGFSNSFAHEMCRKKDDLIQSFLKEIAGRDIKIQYELIKTGDSKSVAAPPTPVSPGTRMNRQQQEEVLSDPAVQIVIRGLSARPVQIERIEESAGHPEDEEIV